MSISKIKIIGNDYTKSRIVLREIHHPIPGEYDSIMAKADRDRIYNLGLFSTVEISQLDTIYLILLTETFNYLPIPLIEYSESKGFSYGAMFLMRNFQGLNRKVSIEGIFGKENLYSLGYYDPWLYGDHGSLGIEIFKYASTSQIYNYEYIIEGVKIQTGYYKKKHRYNFIFNIQNYYMDTTISYLSDYKKFISPFYYNKYQYFTFQLSYKYDNRDIYSDPTRGQYLKMTVEPIISYNSVPNYYVIFISNGRYYKIYKRNELVFSIITKVKFNLSKDLPIFAYEYLGGQDYVRGYSPIIQENPIEVQSKIEGSNIFYQTLQFQHTLLRKKDYGGVELGIDLLYFFDYGLCIKDENTLKRSNILYGFGLGIRTFISGLGIIGLDLGFNPYNSWMLHPKINGSM